MVWSNKSLCSSPFSPFQPIIKFCQFFSFPFSLILLSTSHAQPPTSTLLLSSLTITFSADHPESRSKNCLPEVWLGSCYTHEGNLMWSLVIHNTPSFWSWTANLWLTSDYNPLHNFPLFLSTSIDIHPHTKSPRLPFYLL